MGPESIMILSLFPFFASLLTWVLGDIEGFKFFFGLGTVGFVFAVAWKVVC